METGVWQKVEIRLSAKNQYANPYTDVEVWVDLKGPGFDKRCYGFWDGGKTFIVRVMATAPGQWTWESGASVADDGLCAQTGTFSARAWSEEEKAHNANRRGMVVASPNGHAFTYSDGAPFILCGDTWWSLATNRFLWRDEDTSYPEGPEMGFKDIVQFRKKQGYNGVAMIAAFPTWADDGLPSTIVLDDEEETALRAAWQDDNTSSVEQRGTQAPTMAMENEGGVAFHFPGRVPGYEHVVPDFDQINPDYFRYLDRKMDYLNDNGFVVFIEVSRRDMSKAWKKFYDWPDSYARYIQYIYARYQANACLFSPIHFDYEGYSLTSREFNAASNMVLDKYGAPPFGTLQGTNASPSTLCNFGNPDEARWLTFHQIGNWRDHDHYWYLTEIFQSEPPRPAINGEPYYPGYPLWEQDPFSAEADLNNRSGIFGSFLSGGYGGLFCAYMSLFRGNRKGGKYQMWDAVFYPSTWHLPFLKTFALVEGNRYMDLIPNAELITPNKSASHLDCWRGWAYCAATKEKDFLLAYMEKGCPQETLRGLPVNTEYELKWFDPRNGTWHKSETIIKTDAVGRVPLPGTPARQNTDDWGLMLKAIKKA